MPTDRRDIPPIAVLLAVAAVILAGEFYTYGGGAEAGSEVRLSDDGSAVEFRVSDSGTDGYDVVLIDNASFEATTEAMVFYDPSYGCSEDVAFIETGAPEIDMRTYLDRLGKNLDYLGFDGHTEVDAEELREALESQLASGSCAGRGLIVAAGALPDTVYDGTGDSLVISWIEAGGSLYFLGGSVGSAISRADGTVEVLDGDRQSLFLGASGWCEEAKKATVGCNDEAREALAIRCTDLQYAPDLTGVEDSLTLGYTDGSCSTVSLVRCGEGQVCVFGGALSDFQREDLSVVVASGLSWCSEIVVVASGDVTRGDATGTVDVPASHGALSVYVYLGGYFPIYGERYDLAEVERPPWGRSVRPRLRRTCGASAVPRRRSSRFWSRGSPSASSWRRCSPIRTTSPTGGTS